MPWRTKTLDERELLGFAGASFMRKSHGMIARGDEAALANRQGLRNHVGISNPRRAIFMINKYMFNNFVLLKFFLVKTLLLIHPLFGCFHQSVYFKIC